MQSGKLCDRAGSSEGINLCTPFPLESSKVRTLPSVIDPLWNASVLLPQSGKRFSDYKKKVERECGKEIAFDDLTNSFVKSDGSSALLEQGKYLMLQTALQVRDSLNILVQTAKEQNFSFYPKVMTITGGQASNDIWNQMKSDVLGIDIQVPYCSDAELIGDAAFTYTSLGAYPTLLQAASSLCKIQKVFVPKVQ